MACPFYRLGPPRCSAIVGCLPARLADVRKLCGGDHPERCDIYLLRETLGALVPPGIALALRDKDRERRAGRLAEAVCAWLEDVEADILELAAPSERYPVRILLQATRGVIRGGCHQRFGRVVRDPAACAALGRVSALLRVASRHGLTEILGSARHLIDEGSGL